MRTCTIQWFSEWGPPQGLRGASLQTGGKMWESAKKSFERRQMELILIIMCIVMKKKVVHKKVGELPTILIMKNRNIELNGLVKAVFPIN